MDEHTFMQAYIHTIPFYNIPHHSILYHTIIYILSVDLKVLVLSVVCDDLRYAKITCDES